MKTTELWVKRAALRTSQIVTRELAPLEAGEILVSIDKFALTANNISYAVSGDFIGYWKYFPAEGDWGKVPVWGFADVVQSRVPEIATGERLWGFWPMGTHAVLQPGRITDRQFTDITAHRQPLPGLYNDYMRTKGDSPALRAMEDARCVLFPLFATSYFLYDYLSANSYFGADQVLAGSASSKTGFGLCHLIHRDKQAGKRVIGLTSPRNVPFVRDLAVCDQVVPYEAVSTLDASVPSALVDMSGSGDLIKALHHHYKDNIRESCIVGATHWEAGRSRGELPGAKPAFFFAPAHIAKRDAEWGRGVLIGKAMAASAEITQLIAGRFQITHVHGPEPVQQTYLKLIENEVPPSQGLMLSMKA